MRTRYLYTNFVKIKINLCETLVKFLSDEIGTPLCITIDFETVGDENTPADNCVTVRDRDTMEQVRLPISELKEYIENKIQF